SFGNSVTRCSCNILLAAQRFWESLKQNDWVFGSAGRSAVFAWHVAVSDISAHFNCHCSYFRSDFWIVSNYISFFANVGGQVIELIRLEMQLPIAGAYSLKCVLLVIEKSLMWRFSIFLAG